MRYLVLVPLPVLWLRDLWQGVYPYPLLYPGANRTPEPLPTDLGHHVTLSSVPSIRPHKGPINSPIRVTHSRLAPIRLRCWITLSIMPPLSGYDLEDDYEEYRRPSHGRRSVLPPAASGELEYTHQHLYLVVIVQWLEHSSVPQTVTPSTIVKPILRHHQVMVIHRNKSHL